MASIIESSRRRRTWRWYVTAALILTIVGGLVAGAVMLGLATNVFLRAEERLHATLFTIRLVEQFVHDNGRWPSSWHELEQMEFSGDAPSPLNVESNAIRIGGSHGYNWPAESPHLQECVTIDFLADTNAITGQHPMQFDAIKPNGAHYEYRDYGFVDSLQRTMKNRIVDDSISLR